MQVRMEMVTETGHVREQKVIGNYRAKDMAASAVRFCHSLGQLCPTSVGLHEYGLIEIMRLGFASSGLELKDPPREKNAVIIRVIRKPLASNLVEVRYEIAQEG